MLQTNFNFRHPKPRRAQGGLALIFVLIMMTIVFSIVTITARIATQGDRAARNDRDRQVAFNAAEAAVNEALEDITRQGVKYRYDTLFKFKEKNPFPSDRKCYNEAENRGLCGPDTTGLLANSVPLYADKSIIDWDDASADRKYAVYGEFTERTGDFGNGMGGISAKLPRYIIQSATVQTGIGKNQSSLDGGRTKSSTGYRAYLVTAVGYGANPETRVFLQASIWLP